MLVNGIGDWIAYPICLNDWINLNSEKKKTPWIIDEREIEGIPKKYRGNIVWVLWEVILEEVKSRTNKMIKIQINSLYELYKYNYTVGKRGGRVKNTSLKSLSLPSFQNLLKWESQG